MGTFAGRVLVVLAVVMMIAGLTVVSAPESFSASSPAPAPAPAPRPKIPKSSTIVIRIDFVEPSNQPGIPENANFSVGGQVPTPGWTNPRLVQTDAVQTPESPSGPTRSDRLADFEFVADPPDGVVAQVSTPIGATAAVNKIAYAGVRVWSKTNCIEAVWSQGGAVGGRSSQSLPLSVCKANRDR